MGLYQTYFNFFFAFTDCKISDDWIQTGSSGIVSNLDTNRATTAAQFKK